jgi:hypothetical protein
MEISDTKYVGADAVSLGGHSGQIGTAVTGTHNFFLFQKSYFIQEKNYSYAKIP